MLSTVQDNSLLTQQSWQLNPTIVSHFPCWRYVFYHSELQLIYILAVSSLSFSLANEKELTLLSMIIYPRVIEVLVRILKEKGFVKDFKYADILVYIVCAAICVYFYIFEPITLPPSFNRAINNFSLITKGEGTVFATVAELTSRNIE